MIFFAEILLKQVVAGAFRYCFSVFHLSRRKLGTCAFNIHILSVRVKSAMISFVLLASAAARPRMFDSNPPQIQRPICECSLLRQELPNQHGICNNGFELNSQCQREPPIPLASGMHRSAPLQAERERCCLASHCRMLNGGFIN